MRKVVSGLFITLDGVAQSPDKWQEHFDDEMGESMSSEIAKIDTILLGRVTYEEWVGYWPNATTDLDFANFINNTPKYVFSTTLDKVEWKNATLVKGSLAETIANLKQQPGKNIGVTGSPTLVHSLLEQNLLDELTLLVHPVIAGSGKRLFKDESTLKRLKLLEAKPSSTGTLILTYEVLKQ